MLSELLNRIYLIHPINTAFNRFYIQKRTLKRVLDYRIGGAGGN